MTRSEYRFFAKCLLLSAVAIAVTAAQCQVPAIDNGSLQIVEEDENGEQLLTPLGSSQDGGNVTVPGSTVIMLTCSEGFRISGGTRRSQCSSSSLEFSPKLGRCIQATTTATATTKQTTNSTTRSDYEPDKTVQPSPSTPVDCNVPSMPNGYYQRLNGGVLATGSNVKTGDTIQLICLNGFVVTGDRTLYCLSRGYWTSASAFGQCVPQTNPAPDKASPPNAQPGMSAVTIIGIVITVIVAITSIILAILGYYYYWFPCCYPVVYIY